MREAETTRFQELLRRWIHMIDKSRSPFAPADRRDKAGAPLSSHSTREKKPKSGMAKNSKPKRLSP